MNRSTLAYLQIHFCVLLWGFTAILGKLISLDALPLVWWRMLIVVGVLALLPKVWRDIARLPARLLWAYLAVGALVALHWLTFYAAIKLANASVAATCIALAPVFLAIIEPLMHRRRPNGRDLLVGLAVVPGVALVVGGIPGSMLSGLMVGVLSALLVAAFSSLNKLLVTHADALTVTALELGSGTLLLTGVAGWMIASGDADALAWLAWPSNRDAGLLLVLALACTLLPFTLSLVALRHLSAFSAQLAVNLEPIYAILLAALLFGEQRDLQPGFYAGALIVVAAVFVHPLLKRDPHPGQASSLATAESRSVEP